MEHYAFFLEDEGKAVGGLAGFIYYGCLYIDSLYIDERYRNQGYGSRLVEQAEEFARQKNALFISVNTMDWEALPFYVKLGYQIEYVRGGYENDSKMFFLKKIFSPSKGKKERFRVHAAVCLVLLQNDQVLLLKRSGTGWGDGCYSLPGGAIDGDESLTQAMIRESKEEVGIDIKAENLTLAHVTHCGPNGFNPHETLVFFFKTEKYDGVIENMEPQKHSEVAFFPLNELPDTLLPHGRSALMNMMQKIPYEEVFWAL